MLLFFALFMAALTCSLCAGGWDLPPDLVLCGRGRVRHMVMHCHVLWGGCITS